MVCIQVPARTPHLPARMRPIFLRMKLEPMKALDATASASPLVLSDTSILLSIFPPPARPPARAPQGKRRRRIEAKKRNNFPPSPAASNFERNRGEMGQELVVSPSPSCVVLCRGASLLSLALLLFYYPLRPYWPWLPAGRWLVSSARGRRGSASRKGRRTGASDDVWAQGGNGAWGQDVSFGAARGAAGSAVAGRHDACGRPRLCTEQFRILPYSLDMLRSVGPSSWSEVRYC